MSTARVLRTHSNRRLSRRAVDTARLATSHIRLGLWRCSSGTPSGRGSSSVSGRERSFYILKKRKIRMQVLTERRITLVGVALLIGPRGTLSGKPGRREGTRNRARLPPNRVRNSHLNSGRDMSFQSWATIQRGSLFQGWSFQGTLVKWSKKLLQESEGQHA